MKPRVIAIQQSMKESNYISAAITFSLILTYCICIDFIFSIKSESISFILSDLNIRFLELSFSTILFYAYLATTFKLNFIKLLTGKAYAEEKNISHSFKLVFFTILFYLFFSGRIPYIIIPMVLLMTVETAFLIKKTTNLKFIRLHL
jgi:hypothetical protein